MKYTITYFDMIAQQSLCAHFYEVAMANYTVEYLKSCAHISNVEIVAKVNKGKNK